MTRMGRQESQGQRPTMGSCFPADLGDTGSGQEPRRAEAGKVKETHSFLDFPESMQSCSYLDWRTWDLLNVELRNVLV